MAPLLPSRRARCLAVVLALVSGASLPLSGWPTSGAQVPPLVEPTSTTAPPSSEPPPSGSELSSGGGQAPAGAEDTGGDGTAAPSGGIRVPPEAQRIIDSVRRTGASSNARLLSLLAPLEGMGVPREEALRVGLGRFPIAGAARYSHDWLYPRYGPGFRFHLGTDVFADYGTPVRAPVDGVAQSASGGLGGVTVKVFMPDGTYFYLAHLSGLVEGFANGMPVKTGDIVGYVGASGNARGGAPHLHLGIYPLGGPPVDPKPILDGFLAEAEQRVPAVLEAGQGAQPPAAPATSPPAPTFLRPRLVLEALRAFASSAATVPPEVLYAAAANPLDGTRGILRLAVDDLVAGIAWEP